MSTLNTLTISVICLTLVIDAAIFAHRVKSARVFTAKEARHLAIGNGLIVVALVCVVISEALR